MGITYRTISFTVAAARFAADLHAARKNARMSQGELASLISRPDSFIGQLERANETAWHNLPLGDFLNICNLLDLNPRDFFELDEES